jgi:hypothetical protein
MKKINALLFTVFMFSGVAVFGQADTITGWSFPDSTNLTFNANMGLSGNLGFNIRAEDTAGVVRPTFYTDGAADFAAAADGWDMGADNKFWSARFRAEGYESMRLWSKQSSDPQFPGPKHFKVQVRKSGQGWTDVPGGDVVVSNDWTSGVVADLPLPSVLDNPGNSSLFVRWIMTSDEAVDGNPVLATGISMIDEILITGMLITGVEEVLFDSRLISVYPNPASDFLQIEGLEGFYRVELYDAAGSFFGGYETAGSAARLAISHLSRGTYIVRLISAEHQLVISRKVIVQ